MEDIMKTIYWSIADYNAYIGMQCREYQQRHENTWGRRWWFLFKCTLQNYLQNNFTGRLLNYEEGSKLLRQYDIVSFDIFDTLLTRPYEKPTDLFVELEHRFHMPGFAQERICAEKNAREKYSAQEEITMKQIYEMIKSDYRIMEKREMEMEREVLKARKDLKELYEEAIRQNKRIIIISDMYMSKNILEQILREKTYGKFEKIYVSSEIGYTKASGRMFEYVLEDIGCKAEQVLHIGDNLWSDGNACRKKKMDTLLTIKDKMLYLTCKKMDRQTYL